MARETINHLRSHLSVFEAEYPLQKGYIARLLVVDKRSVSSVFREVRSIVQAAEPDKHFNEGTLLTQLYNFKKLIFTKIDLTREWPSLITLFLQPFPVTFSSFPRHPRVKQVKAAYDKDGEVDELEDISLASDLNKIDNYVSLNSPSHNSHICADVEENRTVVYNSHSSVCVGENVLSDRTSNHQVITSENIKEEMCYTEDVRSGEDKNKQTQKETTESVIDLDFQAMDAGVKDGCNENSEDFNQEHNKLLEQGLSDCDETPQHPKNGANEVTFSMKSFDKFLVNKWKTKSAASQKPYQPLILQSVQKPVLQSDEPSVLQSAQPPVLQSVQSSVLQSDQPSVLQSDQPSVLHSYKCKFCHYGLLLNSSMKEHTLVQEQILPHVCSNCGHAFRLDTVLMKHTNEQTEKKADKSAQFDDNLSVNQPSVVQTSVVQSSDVYPSVVQSSDVQPSDVQPSIVQPSVVQPLILQSYKCKFCHHGFLLKCFLKEHEQVQRGALPYTCSNCGLDTVLIKHTNEQTEKKTSKSAQFDDKLSVLHNNQSTVLQSVQPSVVQPLTLQSYTCIFCYHGFLLKCSLKEHEQVQRGALPYKCSNCGLDTVLIKHTNEQTEKTRKSLQFDDQLSFLDNNQSSILQTDQPTVLQPYTPKFYHQALLLSSQGEHGTVLEHSNSSSLNSHKRIAIIKNVYKCDVCGQGHTRSNDLKRHKMIHTGEKPYKCDSCGKGFVKSSGLYRHNRIHAGKKTYKYDACGKSSMQSSCLNYHKRIHTGEKQYKCDVCDKSFSSSSNLNQHKIIHTGEKPYKCDVCGVAFVQLGNLKTHKMRHTGEKTYN